MKGSANLHGDDAANVSGVSGKEEVLSPEEREKKEKDSAIAVNTVAEGASPNEETGNDL